MAAENTDWRSMFDKDYLGAWDFPGGRDVTLVIAKVARGELTGEGNRKTKKPVVWFKGTTKALAINKTNGSIIAALYGNDTRKWVGKAITLFATTTNFGREIVDCVRVRPRAPQPKAGKQEQPPPPDDTETNNTSAREPGDDSDEEQAS